MKPRILLSLLLLLSLPALAGEPYFCTRPGRTLSYERTEAGSGRLRRTTTFEITAVHQGAAGREVEYLFTLRRPGGAALYGGPAKMQVEIAPDGTVRMDLGSTLIAMLQNLLPRASFRSSGTQALLPPEMHPGDRLPEAHCVVEGPGMKYRIDVTEREVLRPETLTTPAGTFDCIVVREHKVERGPGRYRDTNSDSWYAPGVGYVRHDTYDKNLRLETTEILKNY